MPQTQKFRLKILYFQPDSIPAGSPQLEVEAKQFAVAWADKRPVPIPYPI
ncbi:MAG: hypothetical protein WCK98_07150 [bacterium]